MAILLKKMTIFVNFFFKCQVFGNFLTVKWQFSGGSDLNIFAVDKRGDFKAGMSNLTSKVGQIGPKWDKSGTF